MTCENIAALSDDDLLSRADAAVSRERNATAELIAVLAELDARRVYLGLGYSSVFTYCIQELRLSEPAAYGRICAARAARRFPPILELLASGEVTLTAIVLLAPHLNDENHDAVLNASRGRQARNRTPRRVACPPTGHSIVTAKTALSEVSGDFGGDNRYR